MSYGLGILQRDRRERKRKGAREDNSERIGWRAVLLLGLALILVLALAPALGLALLVVCFLTRQGEGEEGPQLWLAR